LRTLADLDAAGVRRSEALWNLGRGNTAGWTAAEVVTALVAGGDHC
jgi:hypothetical protein